MEIEDIQSICKDFPGFSEDIKWGNDLCLCVGEKMFLSIGLDQNPIPASFKVSDDEYSKLIEENRFKPAPYLARYKWVFTEDINLISREEWKTYARQAYELVAQKLPKKLKKELGITD